MRRPASALPLPLLLLLGTSSAVISDQKGELLPNGRGLDPSRVPIVLTCYANDAHRQQMYVDRVRWWMHNSSFPLTVVESSGKGLPDLSSEYGASPRLRLVVFDQLTEMKKRGMPTVTTSVSFRSSAERLELLKAFEEDRALRAAPLVLKLTGKYVLPTLETEVARLPADVSIVLQRHDETTDGVGPGSTNSELFGFTPALFDTFLRSIPTDIDAPSSSAPIAAATTKQPPRVMESFLGQFALEERRSQAHFLPPLPIPAEMRVARADSENDVLINLREKSL